MVVRLFLWCLLGLGVLAGVSFLVIRIMRTRLERREAAQRAARLLEETCIACGKLVSKETDVYLPERHAWIHNRCYKETLDELR
jgi:hypothetical protein